MVEDSSFLGSDTMSYTASF